MNRERAYALLQKLTLYYEDVLWSSAGAAGLKYLTSPKTDDPATSGRGFTEETVRTWRLGYAPEHGDLSGAFTITEMGMLNEIRHFNKDTQQDRFAGRIVFPIMDDQGQPRGFAGRILSSEKHMMKYTNSPSHEWFKKGEALFGIHLARGSVLKSNAALTMEGYTDTIAAHQAGKTMAVSIMGTYFTRKQFLLLGRYSMNILSMMDGDSAGDAATERSIKEGIDMGFSFTNVNLPDGQDPDDYFIPKAG